MPPSSMLDVGLDVHQESMAGAEVAQEHGAEVTSLGTLGTRPYALDQLIWWVGRNALASKPKV
jgi:hypothetical protein